MRVNSTKARPVFTLLKGVEGVPPLSGTVPELIELLDGYSFEVLHEVFWPEATGRTELYPRLRGYYTGRLLRHLSGSN